MSEKTGRILIIDDDRAVLQSARMVLRKYYEKVDIMESPEKLEEVLRDERYDIILLDMNFSPGETSGEEGIRWLKKIVARDEMTHVVMMTAYGDINLAVEAMKYGAVDFIVKPWENQKLLATVHAAFKLSQSQREIRTLKSREDLLKQTINREYEIIIGRSEAMKKVFNTISKVADTDANILILGENGTGKELIARAIHRESSRADQAFIAVDLGAITETLFESELFGHVKGAFTDAKEDRPGRFELASGGTLFLDEIGNIPPSMQSKLLSVLQHKQLYRVGSGTPINIDIRLISASNAPLRQKAAEQEFREDLLYRINTVEIQVPPLRERPGDIPELLQHFMGKYARKYRKAGLTVHRDSLEKLKKYKWPGNVRELQHLVERAIIMSETNTLYPDDFPIRTELEPEISQQGGYNLEEMEKNAIVAALRRNSNNLSQAARELGLGRTTLYRKIEKYGIDI